MGIYFRFRLLRVVEVGFLNSMGGFGSSNPNPNGFIQKLERSPAWTTWNTRVATAASSGFLAFAVAPVCHIDREAI